MSAIKDLQKDHQKSPFAEYFKEVIYGGVDGIVTTFAVVAGFSGATLSNEATTQLSFMVVLLFGVANLFADGVSMALGNFLSVRSNQDLFNKERELELQEIATNPEKELRETVTILTEKGYSTEDAIAIAELYSKNEPYWADFMMNHELEMADPRGENPVLTGLATFVSFLFFGAIPLIPFIAAANTTPGVAFEYSIYGTFAALFCLGLLKWRVIGENLRKSLLEVMLVGGAAAFCAFYIGTLFAL